MDPTVAVSEDRGVVPPIGPRKLMPPVPLEAVSGEPPLIVPPTVIVVPSATVMALLAVKVIGPAKVLFPERLASVPPLSVTGSAVL